MKRAVRPVVVMLSLSKHLVFVVLAAVALLSAHPPTVCAETETIDLKALGKKARPAVMLLVVSDATGKEIATGTGFLVSSDGKSVRHAPIVVRTLSGEQSIFSYRSCLWSGFQGWLSRRHFKRLAILWLALP